jgi:hypothetical protein
MHQSIIEYYGNLGNISYIISSSLHIVKDVGMRNEASPESVPSSIPSSVPSSIRPVMVLMSAAGYEGNWQSSHLSHSVRKYMCAFTVSVPFLRSRTLSLSRHCVGSENVHCNRSGAISDLTFFGRNLK